MIVEAIFSGIALVVGVWRFAPRVPSDRQDTPPK
jgi:hypothetical protein